MPIYDANVAVLKEAFGPTWSDYCSELVRADYRDFTCRGGSWNANAITNGSVNASGGGGYCFVTSDGTAACRG